MDWNRFAQLTEQCEYQPRSYSGRAMYGRNCVAVVARDFPTFAANLAQAVADTCSDEHMAETVEDMARLFERARIDSMGHDQVIYWPNWAWKEEYENGYTEEPEEE